MSKGPSTPSLDAPLSNYRPSIGFEMRKIKPPKIKGVQKITMAFVNTYSSMCN